MLRIRYSAQSLNFHPREIKLEVPGWAGERKRPIDGAEPQPWHCKPYSDAASYGIELRFQGSESYKVKNENDQLILLRDNKEGGSDVLSFNDPECIFSQFSKGHYGVACQVNLSPPDGYVLRVESHPRLYTASTNNVPTVVPGHIAGLWPKPLFIVLRAPFNDEWHSFEPGDPIAQVVLCPEVEQRIALEELPCNLAALNVSFGKEIEQKRWLYSTRIWRSGFGYWFDNVYKLFVSNGGNSGTRLRKRIEEFTSEYRRTEQGADQPATCSELKSEECEKPQTDSKRRSR